MDHAGQDSIRVRRRAGSPGRSRLSLARRTGLSPCCIGKIDGVKAFPVNGLQFLHCSVYPFRDMVEDRRALPGDSFVPPHLSGHAGLCQSGAPGMGNQRLMRFGAPLPLSGLVGHPQDLPATKTFARRRASRFY